MSPTFKLNGTAQVYMHGIGGRTFRKVRNHDLGVVARLSPDIVILEIGTNDLSLLPPEVVGSEIEELVYLLRQTYHVKVVCVCLLTQRNRNPVFNAKRVIVNKYLTVVLEHMPNVFTWLHQRFARPSVTPFLRDGVHFNKIGQYALYRSYRGAILKSLRML
jgi:lysophospholipase L1-like esterase